MNFLQNHLPKYLQFLSASTTCPWNYLPWRQYSLNIIGILSVMYVTLFVITHTNPKSVLCGTDEM